MANDVVYINGRARHIDKQTADLMSSLTSRLVGLDIAETLAVIDEEQHVILAAFHRYGVALMLKHGEDGKVSNVEWVLVRQGGGD